ncbi:MAG TPA: NYN domain-containing protein [Candidatus Methanoperedens sp.]|nr:NYN domain-containing protein [Candidatus Methanoperedens sp.]
MDLGAGVRIIDGYNLIGVAGEFGLDLSLPDKEERLLRLLVAWRSRRRGREPLLVVFDGHHGRLAAGPRRYSRAGIDVEWAIGESADALIVRRVRAARRVREIEVVTSDRAVAREALSHGARVTRSPDFLAAIAPVLAAGPAPEKPEAPSPDEVEEWLGVFGHKDER